MKVRQENHLNALRGFSALLVFLMHLFTIPKNTLVDYFNISGESRMFWAPVMAGYSGVGFFIFLSGFLLALSIHRNKESFKVYLFHRFLRIYPIYLVVLFFGIMASRQWDFHGFINAIFLLPNLPGTLWPFPYLATAWSLGIEWTLYFSLFFLLWITKNSLRTFLSFQLLIFLLILSGKYAGIDFHTLVYGSFLGRLAQFSLGLFVAHFYLNYVERNGELRQLISKRRGILLSLLLIVYWIWSIISMELGGPASNGIWRLSAPYAESLICAGLVLVLVVPIDGKPTDLVLKPFNFMGHISYPFYLIHVSALYFIDTSELMESLNSFWIRTATLFFSSLLFSIFFSWLMSYSIEQPIEKWKKEKRSLGRFVMQDK